MRKGAILIISAPSGAGKTTICRRLLAQRKDARYSVSCTTRAPRAGERHGKAYFFLERDDFKRKIARHEFLEWAMVHEEYYGTPRRFIEDAVASGRHVLLAIDVQGALAIRRKMPSAVLVFVMPPSIDALRERLAARRDAHESVAKRLVAARAEIAAAKDYDYVVVNDDLDAAVAQIDSILTAETLRTSRLDLAHLTPAHTPASARN